MTARAACAALCAALVCRAAAGWDGGDPGNFSVAAVDEYAWALFVTLNRPAEPGTCVDGPVVWETWATAADLFRPDGSDPGQWRRRPASCDSVTAGRFETLSRKSFEHPMHIVNGRMQPQTDATGSTEHLTEIRFNGVSFDYVRAAELYNLDGQERRYAQREAVSFPRGAIDVKARWRVIGKAESSRYHTLQVSIDGVVRLYGLTALHIASKSRPNWVWATFEHVDNPSRPGSEGWQLPSRDTYSCPADHPDCNEAPQGIGLDGTVWQNYRLRGTMTEFVDASNRPQLLANSELERGMQQTASCITCHSRASIGVADGTPARLAVLDERGETRPGGRRGYIGLPSEQWFGIHGADSQPLFQPLDFVWSLAKARPLAKPRNHRPPAEPGDSP